MAKWYGNIGFAEPVESQPGYYEDKIIVRPYSGDTIKNTRLLQTQNNSTNDNVNVANQISILADPYANNHFYAMRYIEFQGAKWEVTSAESQYPRLILTIGGLWNGN